MTEDLITSEIQFFRVSGKDYIIAADKRNIYLLDRTGNIRLRLKEPVAKADNSEIRISFTKGPEIILSSPGGIIQRISFDGSVNKTEIRRFSEKHSFDYFDIDGDGDGEYIFIDEGILYLYESDKTEVFTRDFGSTDLEGPWFFVFSSGERKIGVSDNNKKLVYLVDKNGTIEAGVPLKGVSGFSIGKMSEKGEFRLVVGGIDNFLYNYRLDLK
jgi:hypothetical protein